MLPENSFKHKPKAERGTSNDSEYYIHFQQDADVIILYESDLKRFLKMIEKKKKEG